MARDVVQPRDGGDAIESLDLEGEGEGSAAELGAIALALRFRREGQAHGDAVIAVMARRPPSPTKWPLARSVAVQLPKPSAGHSAS